MLLYSNNKIKQIHINENQINLLEAVRYTPNSDGTIDMSIPAIKYGGDGGEYEYSKDYKNTLADTRAFGYRSDILNNLQKNDRAKREAIKFYDDALNMCTNMNKRVSGWNANKYIETLRDKYYDNAYVSKATINATINHIINIRQYYLSLKRNEQATPIEELSDYKEIYRAKIRAEKELNMIHSTYSRAYYGNGKDSFIDSTGKNLPAIPRYSVGIVPGTEHLGGIKVIALFKFSNFNFSDGIKNGEYRQDKLMRKILGINDGKEITNFKWAKGSKTLKKINATYDDGKVLHPSIENNFSLNGTNLDLYDSDEGLTEPYPDKGHYKYAYNTFYDKDGNTVTDYSTISQFMDKSIMYAAFALRKEGIKPDYILAAPSSSDYNHYYCINLSRKLGIPYNPRFFTRNLIHVELEEERAKKAGIPQQSIDAAKATLKVAAISEITSYMMKEVKKFVKDNWDILSDIPIVQTSRGGNKAQRADYNMVCTILNKASYYALANIGVYNNSDKIESLKLRNFKSTSSQESSNAKLHNVNGVMHPKTTNVYKYLVNHFSEYTNNNINIKGYDMQLIINNMINIIKTKGLSLKYQQLLRKIKDIVNVYEDRLLSEDGYRLSGSKKFKITDVDAVMRPFIKNAYVVADKELAYSDDDTVDKLRGRLNGKEFLIIDEDMNSGGTLKLLSEALMDKDMASFKKDKYGNLLEPKRISNNQITCLVNLWTLQAKDGDKIKPIEYE